MTRLFPTGLLLAALSFGALHSCQSPAKAPDPAAIAAARLDSVFTEDHEMSLRNYPTWATYEGDDRYNDRLTEMSHQAYEARAAESRDMLRRVEAIDTAGMDEATKLNRALFIREIRSGLEAHELGGWKVPFNQQNGPHIDFPQIIEVQPLEDAADYADYMSRLRAFPTQLMQTQELLKYSISEGNVPPRFTVEQVIAQCRSIGNMSLEESPFNRPLREGGTDLGDARSSIEAEMNGLITETINPAYLSMADWLEKNWLPMARQEPGIHAVPGGEQKYAYAVRYHTTTDLSPDEVFEIGESEVARIKGLMEELVAGIGYDGDLDSFIDYLRTDPQFYYESKEPMMEEYRRILTQMDENLPSLFGILPEAPYELKEIEEYRAANAPQAYYYSAPEDRSRPGYFYVNTTNLPARPKYTMTALALHEAVPGHHLQIAIAQELPEMPWFRQNLSSTAFVEGWALYAEALGYETNMYEDPYQQFGALTFEMWRACRLVVDVGIHHKGWSREQAVQYMLERTPNSEADIRSEVDRYIAWPGQALAYKIGELKIKELRAKAEEELGDAFDIKGFHDAVLENGPLPLDLLEENVLSWIAEQGGRPAS